uniref:Uncharacterized protein n=1 Tax=Arundo donax TaxID=35708 RepID=A0A0A9FNI2_ARUDO
MARCSSILATSYESPKQWVVLYQKERGKTWDIRLGEQFEIL